MEQNELEKQLKEEAKKLKVKSFSERWDIIKSKINNVEPVTREEQLIDVPATVLAGAGVNTTSSKHDLKRKRLLVGISLAVLFCLIILAVVLPLSLHVDNGLRLYEVGDLRVENVSDDEFYDSLEESGLNIVDLSDFEVTAYAIFYSTENTVKGGMVELFDEQTQTFAIISIYTSDVNVYFNPDFEKLDLDNLEIYYSTIIESDVYRTEAYSLTNDLKYYLNILSIEEPENFLDRLFL